MSNNNMRPYAEGSIGLGFINAIDLGLAAPQANLVTDANNFYESTSWFTWAVQGGLLWNLSPRLGGFAQLGLRYVSGLADVDNIVGEGLDDQRQQLALDTALPHWRAGGILMEY